MSDTKHTPGSWQKMDARSFGVPYIITDGKVTLAQTYEGYSKDETEANAKLIAAAPEMLAALINLKTYIDLDKTFRDMWSEDLAEVIKKATE